MSRPGPILFQNRSGVKRLMLTPKQLNEDRYLDLTLRPCSFDEYMGQQKIKDNLKILMEAAKKRREPIEHVLLYGGSGLGKCINKNSIVFTEKGMLEIGQLGRLNKKGFQKKKIKIYSNPGLKSTSHFYNNGQSKTIKIETHQGFELEGTLNHPIVALDNNGEIIFKPLEKLKKGDYVAIQRGQNCFGHITTLPKFDFQPKSNNFRNYDQYTIPKKLTPELARICGYLIGDGYINSKSGSGTLTFNNDNKEILRDFQKLWFKIFNQKTKIKKYKNKCPLILINNSKVRQFLLNIDLPYSTAPYKHIPSVIMQAPKEIVKEFLKGYFECDGHIRPNCRQIDVSSASRTLLKQIQIILLNFGIISRLYEDHHKKQKAIYWRLWITGGDVDIFNQEIGFISSQKTQAQDNFSPFKNTNKDLVPYAKNKIKEIKQVVSELNRALYKKHYRHTSKAEISSGEMNKCLDIVATIANKVVEKAKEHRKLCSPQIFWDKIVSIKQSYAQTVDVTVPSNHTFFANGFINHNTTLAHVIAKEMNCNIKVTSGPAIEKVGDLASILTNLQEGDILFCDECHRLNKTIEEVLYPAMEDFLLDIIIGKGPSARTLRLELPRFTLIAATTRIGLLSSPLRSRFGVTFRLDFYKEEDIEKIIERSAKILKTTIEPEAIQIIARCSRWTPRVANRLLKRIRDYAQVKADGLIDRKLAQEALKMLEIDELGLEPTDRYILETIIKKFNGGPVGLQALAAATNEEQDTIEEIYEPYLLRLGFLARTPKGRLATQLAYQHLGLKYSGQNQARLW